jgi:hypothetical protein
MDALSNNDTANIKSPEQIPGYNFIHFFNQAYLIRVTSPLYVLLVPSGSSSKYR